MTRIMSDKENANLLNKYFSSVFTEDNDSPELIFNSAHKELFDEDLPEPFNFTQQTIKEPMPDIDITEEDVLLTFVTHLCILGRCKNVLVCTWI